MLEEFSGAVKFGGVEIFLVVLGGVMIGGVIWGVWIGARIWLRFCWGSAWLLRLWSDWGVT